MLPPPLCSPRYPQLRESYIAISTYLRGRHSRHAAARCPHRAWPSHKFRVTARANCAPFYTYRALSEDQADKSITEGFPAPPEPPTAPGADTPGDVGSDEAVDLNAPEPVESMVGRSSNEEDSQDGDPVSQGISPYMEPVTAARGSWDVLQKSFKPGETHPVTLYGYITERRSRTKEQEDLRLADPFLRQSVRLSVRKAATLIEQDGSHEMTSAGSTEGRTLFRKVAVNMTPNEDPTVLTIGISGKAQAYSTPRPHTPVMISGYAVSKVSDGGSETREDDLVLFQDDYVGDLQSIDSVSIKVQKMRLLNSFPLHVIAKRETNFPPEKRHLELRTKRQLRDAIRSRSRARANISKYMFNKGFDEVETPILFKSTPEGAREFMVPTRKKGMAYALPQSPQQYKQLLMASGIARYFQFARCFRDEDMRTDRQPEFTQLDLEMAFASGQDVMNVVEELLAGILWPLFKRRFTTGAPPDGRLDSKKQTEKDPTRARTRFPVYSYSAAMRVYGSDKPDLGIGSRFFRIEKLIPESLRNMLTSLDNPVIDLMHFRMYGCHPAASGKFVADFLDKASSARYLQNPAGAPGVTVFDPQKPLEGLASFGHEAAHKVKALLTGLEAGDILIVQARPRLPFTGGSTPLGDLRVDIFKAAVAQKLRRKPSFDQALWVTDFPLFSPLTDKDPGQGGEAGICSTHHPFTAPLRAEDIKLLTSRPLEVTGDHYDLVINGVEVGGGSRRIHDSTLQKHILRDVLKMKPERVEDFRHLLNALEAGCPPHAGFALGFDRLMAILMNKSSIRDVVAFPKWGDGEDRMVGAPSRMTAEQLETYHLSLSS